MYKLNGFNIIKQACTRDNAYSFNDFFVKLNAEIVTAFD